MTGFNKAGEEEEKFGVRDIAEKGKWYSYSQYGQGHTFGRFAALDKHEPIAYFDKGPIEEYDATGAKWVLKEGEIAIPLSQIVTFYDFSEKEAEQDISLRNWYRQFHDHWVAIKQQHMDAFVGKARQVFASTFHLMPYISTLNGLKLVEGQENIVMFERPFSIEILTKEALDKYGVKSETDEKKS